MGETADHDTSYATVAYVTLEGRRQDDLRKSDASHVHELFAAQAETTQALFAGLKDSVRAEVDRINALFSAGQRELLAEAARTNATATSLATGVKELSATMAQGVEDTRKANQLAVDQSNDRINERIKPLEDAMNTNGGRTTVIDKMMYACVGSVLVLVGGIASKMI